MPPALVRLVLRQHGAFSHAQALVAGMTPAQIRTRLRRDDWVRVQPCV